MTVRCIIFDLDNTLWDCDSLIVRAEEQFYLWLQSEYPQISNQYEPADLLLHRMDYFKTRPDQLHNLTALRKDWMRQLAVDVGITVTNEQHFEMNFIEKGFQVFWAERNKVVFYDGVMEMLESLSQQYSLGVISNGNADIDFIGIGHFFDFTMSSEIAGVSKPHEGIFHKAMQLSKYTLEDSVYVGDDPKCDVLGPQNIGMRALWYNPTLKPWPGGKTPAAVFKSHNELEDKISKL